MQNTSRRQRQRNVSRFEYDQQIIHGRVTKTNDDQQLIFSRLETKVGNLEGKRIMLQPQNENLRVIIDNQEQDSR